MEQVINYMLMKEQGQNEVAVPIANAQRSGRVSKRNETNFTSLSSLTEQSRFLPQ